MFSDPAELPGGVRRATLAGFTAFDAGPLDGPPVLLLPGYTGSKEDYLPVLPLLGAAGLRAVAVDQRGQYESPVDPDGGEAQFELAALAADIERMAAEFGEPAHVVGHSYGGLVARLALIDHPGSLASVVLLGSGPSAIGGARAVALRAMRMLYERSGRDVVWQAIRAADPDQHSPEELAFIEHRFFTASESAMRLMGESLLAEPDRTVQAAASAAANGIPLLVAHGVDDDAWPPPLQSDMAARLGARYAVIPDAVHSPAAQNPAGTADVLVEFVSDVVSGRIVGPGSGEPELAREA
jgi:pimeloyl-ACP methyl ester carboxylesterase